MAIGLGDMPIIGIYDFSWVAAYAGTDPERTLIVDVGGGKGQAIKAIIEETPSIPASACVLQDLPNVINDVPEEEGILNQVQKVGSSFFDKQPIKGTLALVEVYLILILFRRSCILHSSCAE
jgi:hypothetical protein